VKIDPAGDAILQFLLQDNVWINGAESFPVQCAPELKLTKRRLSAIQHKPDEMR
jgi:hypothetical protein